MTSQTLYIVTTCDAESLAAEEYAPPSVKIFTDAGAAQRELAQTVNLYAQNAELDVLIVRGDAGEGYRAAAELAESLLIDQRLPLSIGIVTVDPESLSR